MKAKNEIRYCQQENMWLHHIKFKWKLLLKLIRNAFFVLKENSIGEKYFLILGCDRLYYIAYYSLDWNKNQ